MNIGMLVIVSLPATWRLHLRWRVTLKFPPGVIRRASGLALVGLLEFLAADIYSVVTINLANGHGETGALVLVNYGNLVFTAICSVLPLAIVISAFPVLSATEGDAFDRTSAGSTRAVMLLSLLSTAVMIAVALPAAHVLTQKSGQVAPLAAAFLLFAPGVAGFAIVTNLSRVLFALGKLRLAAIGLVAQQLLPAALAFPLVLLAPPRLTVGALALASSIGQLATAFPMVAATRRLRGSAALAGLGHATLAGVAAAAAGAAAGLAVALVMPTGGTIYETCAGAVATILAVVVFGVVAYALDKGDTRAAAARLRRFVKSHT
jgi:putative peptidoglycan lipid II flippase